MLYYSIKTQLHHRMVPANHSSKEVHMRHEMLYAKLQGPTDSRQNRKAIEHELAITKINQSKFGSYERERAKGKIKFSKGIKLIQGTYFPIENQMVSLVIIRISNISISMHSRRTWKDIELKLYQHAQEIKKKKKTVKCKKKVQEND
jgi:hypothetical protein